MTQFKEMLSLHWKAARWPLAPMVLLAFGLPMLMMRAIQMPRLYYSSTATIAGDMIRIEQGFVAVFPVLAAITGAVLALTAWSWDHSSRHIYALALPVSRARYSLLKLAAGALLVLVPVLALLAGCLVGIGVAALPPELHAYPFSFALRFMLACMIAYAATFALAASTMRTTILVIGGLLVLLIFGTIAVEFLRDTTDNFSLISPAEILIDAFVRWPGPFSVFGGSWLLVDA